MRLRLFFLCTLLAPLAVACAYEDQCDIRPQSGGAELSEAAPLRNPNSGQCESFGWPGGGGGGGGGTCGDYQDSPQADRAPIPDWGICDGFCETLSETDCLTADECRGAYVVPYCPPDALCDDIGPQFHQCWAISTSPPYSDAGCQSYAADECARHNECSAVHDQGESGTLGFFLYCSDEPGDGPDPGSCVGEVACDEEPPICPVDTVPGRIGACWSGFCIPVQQCDVVPACETLSEAECVNRSGCNALYEGVDCTCTGADCVCSDWVFESCETM